MPRYRRAAAAIVLVMTGICRLAEISADLLLADMKSGLVGRTTAITKR